MIRTGPWPRSRKKLLAQQQSDFTSEGSPPPGKVAASEPKLPQDSQAPVPAHTRKTSRSH